MATIHLFICEISFRKGQIVKLNVYNYDVTNVTGVHICHVYNYDVTGAHACVSVHGRFQNVTKTKAIRASLNW